MSKHRKSADLTFQKHIADFMVRRDEAFNEEALPDLTSEALDFRAASEVFSPVRKARGAVLCYFPLREAATGPQDSKRRYFRAE